MKFDTKTGILVSERDRIEEMFHKSLNRKIAKENLLLIKNILDKNKIEFRLIYGTLLGAIRENDFIKGDEDTDLFLFRKDKKKVFDCLKEFENNEFKLIRCLDNMISVERKNEYLDFYFFEQKGFVDKLFNRVVCGHGFWWIYVQNKYLEGFDEIDFLGTKFKGLKNSVDWLEFTYGDWKTPKKESADTRTFCSTITKYVGKLLRELR